MTFSNKKIILLFGFTVFLFLFSFGIASAQCPQERPDLGIDCRPDAYYCGGACRLPGDIPVCGGGELLDCGSCTCGCPSGQISCPAGCQDPLGSDCIIAYHKSVANACTGECNGCLNGWFDCDANPIDCETRDVRGTSCAGGVWGGGDACNPQCVLEQPYVPLAGEVGTANPNQLDETNSLIYLDQNGTGDFMKFFGPDGTIFYMNNAGQMGVEKGVDAGNFISFKDSSDSEVFAVENNGKLWLPEICIDGDCRTSWPGAGTGTWTDAGTYIYSDEVGDYEVGAGVGSGLQITKDGDLSIDGDLTVAGSSIPIPTLSKL